MATLSTIGHPARGRTLPAAIQIITLAVAAAVLFSGCSSWVEPREADPDYAAYLDAYKQHQTEIGQQGLIIEGTPENPAQITGKLTYHVPANTPPPSPPPSRKSIVPAIVQGTVAIGLAVVSYLTRDAELGAFVDMAALIGSSTITNIGSNNITDGDSSPQTTEISIPTDSHNPYYGGEEIAAETAE